MKRTRVLLADDHAILLEAFASLLEPVCDVVGTVRDGRALLEAVPRLKPDVVVLDISMPLLNGMDAGQQLKKLVPETKLIYLTVNEDPLLVSEAFRSGASGYILKNSAASELFEAIKMVMRGRKYVTPLVTGDVLEALHCDPNFRRATNDMIPRQKEVLQLLAEGHSMKEAARILDLSPRTIAFHKYKMMEELQIKTSAELIQFATENGLGFSRHATRNF